MTGAWLRRDRHAPPVKEDRHIPVPQGQRGIRRARHGQLRQLPPPAVGITALTAISGLDIPVPGSERRGGHAVPEYGT